MHQNASIKVRDVWQVIAVYHQVASYVIIERNTRYKSTFFTVSIFRDIINAMARCVKAFNVESLLYFYRIHLFLCVCVGGGIVSPFPNLPNT